MGESACLMQPFSYTAPEGDSLGAFGQSVSFGRFMSEKLDWERWSGFSTQNRYVAEAERYSRPGSVAQKKAFFEAHYKKLAAARKAAAEEALLLEMQNLKPQPEKLLSDQDDVFVSKPDMEIPRGSLDALKLLAEKVTRFGNRKADDEKENHEKVKPDQTEKTPILLKAEKTPILLKSEKTPILLKKKSKDSPPTSSSKPRATKCDSTQRTPSQKPKNRSSSYTFTPAKEFNRLVSIVKKIDGSRLTSKSSKDCKTPLRTPSNKVSAKGIVEDSLSTPLSSQRRCNSRCREKIAPDSSAKTSRGIWTPSCFTPFSLRTEERAERRKKKLEEKFKDMESQNQQPEATVEEKSVEKGRSKLQQRLCFKAKPLPNFYKQRPKSTDQTRKALLK